jgi:2-keto-4-pentenoate hydratase/2-oxohepta-3-ene-1,7-dioic acid hydratase in catechol pathway
MPLALARPGKIVCVGRNYREHAEETGSSIPAAPLLFAKFPTAMIGPNDPIVIPPFVRECDFEGELGVVVGATIKGISRESAFEAVLGYVAANDVTARDLQASDKQWTRGKSIDTFCPVGSLAPASAVTDPHDLVIRTIVSGETMQESSTSLLIFGIDEVISYASQSFTLEPGDLILTGTPGGVGFAREPKRLLEHGDTVTVQIEGVGEITNPVVRAS